ncbi:MAG: restriction endonuclease [Gemmatimonadetes bacterium]|nr:restriction endonuclease [Gemmatimonadota bacterium]
MSAAESMSDGEMRQILEYLHQQRSRRSLRSLAAEIGISRSALDELCREHHVPRVRTAVRIKDYYRQHAGRAREDALIHLPSPPLDVTAKWNLLLEEIASARIPLHALDWKAFEDLIARLLERFSWQVTSLGYTKDGGADLLAVKQVNPGVPFEMLVQCKRFAPHRKVGISYVRELWSVRCDRSAHQAMLATTSGFTRGAVRKADEWKLDLRDHDRILDWCRNAAGIYIREVKDE